MCTLSQTLRGKKKKAGVCINCTVHIHSLGPVSHSYERMGRTLLTSRFPGANQAKAKLASKPCQGWQCQACCVRSVCTFPLGGYWLD